MNKKTKIILGIVVIAIIVAVAIVWIVFGGKKTEIQYKQSALYFKEEYESVNGKTMANGIEYRSLNIDKNNPYVKVSIDEIAKKIENGETFYLYVGDHLCPWCRSGLEKMIEVANREKIDTIYYVDFWDDDHNEILRDLYDVEIKGKKTTIVKTKEATEGYKVLYEAVKDFIQDYTFIKDGVEYNAGVKKVYGGDHFYFNKGVCEKYISLRVPLLEKANDELTEDILKEQDKTFTELFTASNVCEDNNC